MVKHNSFCLSLLSPVFHKMLCFNFKEKTNRQIKLDDWKEMALRTVMELACWCEEGVRVRGVGGMSLEPLQTSTGWRQWSQAVVSSVTVEMCCEVLHRSGGGQLPHSESTAWTLVPQHFKAVSLSRGFLGLKEEVMCSLVRDNKLAAEENAVLEAVVEWIKAEGGKEGSRQRLLGEILYGLLEA